METQRNPTRPAKAPARLEIRLLGEIRLKLGSEHVSLPASKRTRALLGYLAAAATAQSRQTLCDLLWDGPDDPRAALRWSLTKLRPLVNEPKVERLKADREHVIFSLDDVYTDIKQLGGLLRADPSAASTTDIEAAADLMQGEFLDGLDLPSCYRFHHWCLAERERWGALRRKVLLEAVGRFGAEPERALPYARTLVATDPLSELAHGKLVMLLSTLGRRKDAHDHYAHARDMLQREMGAPLTGELKPPVRPKGSLPRAPWALAEAKPSAPNLDVAIDTGLIGRAGECAAIDEAIGALATVAAGQGLLFLGEPGIGKSRLLDYAAKQAGKAGARVLSARCFEAEAVRPFGCWADLLGPLIADTADASARRDLALFLPSSDAPANAEGNRTRLFAAVMALLFPVAAKVSLVLMIDDLQWIDEASSALLHFILRASDNPARLLFVGAARADEIDDNPWCKRVVGALAQDGAVKRIRLAPLGDYDAASFFAPGSDPGDIGAALQQSGGNPLFLTELANAGRSGQPASGRDLDALIADRIARLEEPERELIVFAAATARDFKPELLGAAMGLPELQLLDRIGRLEHRGLLKATAEGRFDFAHDLIRQTTYRGLSQPRRRLIHRQIARALGEAARLDPSLAGELAYHAGAAGDHALAVQAAIAAGEHCLRLFANAAAIDAADRGLGHLQQLPIGPERAHRHIALLKVKVFASASPSVRIMPKLYEELQQAVEAAELMGLRSDDAAVGWHMISWWSHHSNDAVGARQAILRAEALTRPMDEVTHCQQLASTGRCLLEVEADTQRARTFLGEADQIAAKLERSFVELDWGHGLIARWDGDLAGARSSMRRALTLARLQEDRWREIECLECLVKIAIEGEGLTEVGAICDEIDAIAARIGDGPAPVADALRALALLLEKGDAGEADLRDPLAALRAFDDKAQLAYVLNQVAAFRLARGRLDGARTAAMEALGAARAVKRTTEIVVASAILASIEAGSGDTGQAARSIESLLAGVGDVSALSARARADLDRVRQNLPIPTPVQTVEP